MVNLERNEVDFIKNTVRNMIQNPRVGHVVQVYEHLEEDDGSNFEVDVNFPGESNLEHRVAPVEGPHTDSIAVPKVGDKVVVEYLHGDKKNPIVRNVVGTNQDRPPEGSSGMWRKKIESGLSPAGDGDLYLTTHTTYDENPALNDYRELDAEESRVRIAKKEKATDTNDLPLSFELVDSPQNDEAYVKFEANKANGSDSTVPYGFILDLSDGSFKLIDKEGYGIESDGSGNFTWHHETIDKSQGTTTSL